MSKEKGIFITFEGADGSGKTTMLNHMQKVLLEKGYRVISTKEPGGTDVALKIREIIVNEDKQKDPIDSVAQLLLFYASRIQHVKNKIIPALESGTIVLCDRYSDSTAVYQGLLHGLQSTINALMGVDSLSYLKQRPDHVLFYEVTSEVSKNRAISRGALNSLDIEYLSKKDIPIQLFKTHMDSFEKFTSESDLHFLNANNDIADVQMQTEKILEHILNKTHTSKFIDRITN